VLCFAPTRSGKGVGLVVPTLLTWPGSCVVHDIKGENWTLTSGFRARHGRVLLFDPTNSGSAAYNPLLEVRRGEWEVRDVQNVADVLVDPEGSLERRNHWEKTSHALAAVPNQERLSFAHCSHTWATRVPHRQRCCSCFQFFQGT
jgi:type IV secretion system protein VirD4